MRVEARHLTLNTQYASLIGRAVDGGSLRRWGLCGGRGGYRRMRLRSFWGCRRGFDLVGLYRRQANRAEGGNWVKPKEGVQAFGRSGGGFQCKMQSARPSRIRCSGINRKSKIENRRSSTPLLLHSSTPTYVTVQDAAGILGVVVFSEGGRVGAEGKPAVGGTQRPSKTDSPPLIASDGVME